MKESRDFGSVEYVLIATAVLLILVTIAPSINLSWRDVLEPFTWLD